MMDAFPRPRESTPEFDVVVEAWATTADEHDWPPGASAELIREVEQETGRTIPIDLRGLYSMSSEVYLPEFGLRFFPLKDDDPSNAPYDFANAAAQLREWEWPIPDELVMIGDFCGDDLFGIWLPRGRHTNPNCPIIKVGEIFEPRCMAVVGSTFARFAKTRTTIELLVKEHMQDGFVADRDVLRLLGVPDEWRNRFLSNGDYNDLSWADPDLPHALPDPYENGLTAEQLREMYGANE